MNKRKLTDIELIAQFMELPIKFGNWRINGEQTLYFKLDDLWVDSSHLKYNKSWNWLMPAIQKLLTVMKNSQYSDKVLGNLKRGILERAIWDYCYSIGTINTIYMEFINILKWHIENQTNNTL